MEHCSAGTAKRLIIPVEPGCELRSFVPDDALAMHRAIECNRVRLREWLPWLDWSQTLDEARSFVCEKVVENEKRTALTMGIWVGDQFAGAIGLHRIDLRHRNTSIGYWIGEEYSGRGVMTKACSALVTAGFQEYGLHRIEIRCATGNHRSAAIAHRLGFIEEGLLREAEWLYDHWVDLRVFSMLEGHWQGSDPGRPRLPFLKQDEQSKNQQRSGGEP